MQLIDASQSFFLMLLLLSLSLLFLFLLNISCQYSEESCINCTNKGIRCFIWGVFLRLFLESFLEVFLFSLLNIRSVRKYNPSTQLNQSPTISPTPSHFSSCFSFSFFPFSFSESSLALPLSLPLLLPRLIFAGEKSTHLSVSTMASSRSTTPSSFSSEDVSLCSLSASSGALVFRYLSLSLLLL